MVTTNGVNKPKPKNTTPYEKVSMDYVNAYYIHKDDVKRIIDAWYDDIDIPSEWIVDELEGLIHKRRV